MAWIGAQNSHRKHRIAVVATSGGTLYGLTVAGEKQLHEWEKYPSQMTWRGNKTKEEVSHVIHESFVTEGKR